MSDNQHASEGYGKSATSVAAPETINGEDLQGEAQAQAFLQKKAHVIDPQEILVGEEEPELNPTTGVPKVLKTYLVFKDPDIYLIPNLVSEAEAEHLLELANEYWIPSVVGRGQYKTNDESKDLTNKPSQNRTSYSCMLKSAQTSMVEGIEARIAAVAGMEVEYLERLNLVRYSPGQFFNKHHDGRFRPVTVFLYLNDLEKEDDGETFFPVLGLKIKPMRGCAVMWRNTHDGKEDMRMVHCGLPPKTGVKFGVNCFFNQKPVKSFEEMTDDVEYATIDPVSLCPQGASTQPGRLSSFVVHNNPKVAVVPSFLSAEEADALISVVKGQQLDDASIYERIEERCALLAKMPLAQMEPIKVAKSEENTQPEGVLYSKYEDGSYTQKFGVKTLSIFLNDVAEGGELRFPRLRFQIQPREGTAVLWSGSEADDSEAKRAVHQGRPPKAGTRFAATCVFRVLPVRQEA